ncbi:MAG: HNH endonuclease [Proteobacteria bacterium]|nr:HNH endonuclease [Pseudomonadota bacterium]
MEKMLGRFLDPKEVVHHLNRDRLDNRPENLAVFQNNGEHLRHELVGKRPKWSEAGLRRILEGLERGRKKTLEAAAIRKAACGGQQRNRDENHSKTKA